MLLSVNFIFGFLKYMPVKYKEKHEFNLLEYLLQVADGCCYKLELKHLKEIENIEIHGDAKIF